MTAISIGQAPSAPANRAASGPIPTYHDDDAPPRTQFRAALRAATKTNAPKPAPGEAGEAGDDQALAQAQAAAGAQALAQTQLAAQLAPPVATGEAMAGALIEGVAASRASAPAATNLAPPAANLAPPAANLAPPAANLAPPAANLAPPAADLVLGDATQGIATPGAPAPQGGAAPSEDSPVAAWLAAAVGRAISSFSQGGQAKAKAGANPLEAVDAKATDATKATLALSAHAPAALTPLEQAVHELIGQLGERKPGRATDDKLDTDTDARSAIDPSALAFARADAPITTAPNASPHRIDAAAPARALQQPELPTNPSHVHMVLDDGPERVVMTVAVRGSEVHVALRGGDDATTNALARNAASLDDAMRARGLSLGDFKAERDPSEQRQRQPEREQRERPEPNANAEPFQLEELR